MISDTSLAAYDFLRDNGLLQPMEKRVMLWAYGHGRPFTRKECSALSGMQLASVCGRVNTLVEKGFLEELPEIRNRGHVLRIAGKQLTLDIAA